MYKRQLIHRLGWSHSQLSRWSLHEPGGMIQVLQRNNTDACLQFLSGGEIRHPQAGRVSSFTCVAVRKINTLKYGHNGQLRRLELCSGLSKPIRYRLPSALYIRLSREEVISLFSPEQETRRQRLKIMDSPMYFQATPVFPSQENMRRSRERQSASRNHTVLVPVSYTHLTLPTILLV